jgi:ATP adenylyltransferase
MKKVLWAPWRMEYILSDKPGGCIFCTKPNEDGGHDRDNYILYRGERCFVIMNAYPYNNGHLMVIPNQHAEDIALLPDETLADIMRLAKECTRILREAMGPQGFNLGFNIGAAAGAGIKEHVHMHIVPRWSGDTNFMAVLDDVRVLPQHLKDTYDQLRPAFQKLEQASK